MITQLTLRNFKSVGEEVYGFTQFDLLVGRNNSGKSTVLQALAIWQFCVDEFHRSKRSGSKGIQVVLPNFTALPVPEFNLLWKDRTDRHWPLVNGSKKQEYILIGIDVEWRKASGETASFGVELRYHSSQTIYAIPGGGWEKFALVNRAATSRKLPMCRHFQAWSLRRNGWMRPPSASRWGRVSRAACCAICCCGSVHPAPAEQGDLSRARLRTGRNWRTS